VLGPIEQVASSAEIAPPDPVDQEQEQQQADKKSGKSDSDQSDVDAALGLISTGPVQLHPDLDEPVTSGSDIFSEGPGTTN
jgi:hypothetical protein